MFITKQSNVQSTKAEGKANPIFMNLVLANSITHSKILVTTHSASASLNSLIYNYDQGARSSVSTCLYMHTATSLETLCDSLKLSPLFAFNLIAKNNDKKNGNNVGDPPKLMIFNTVRLFISRKVKEKREKCEIKN